MELVAGRSPLSQATSAKQRIPKAERVFLHGNESVTRGFFSFLPADDGPYCKGGKDVGGTDVALACRRQSIPGNEPPLLPPCPGGTESSESGSDGISSAANSLCDLRPVT